MFERLVLYFTEDKDYLDVGILALFFTLLSAILVQNLVPFHVGGQELAGVMVVLITSLALAYPFVRYLLLREQAEVDNRWSEPRLLRRHAEEFLMYIALFLGCTVAFAVSTFFVSDTFYDVQVAVLQSIGVPTGQIVAEGAGGLVNVPFMLEVIQNNLWVFLVTFFLTFFVTSGLIFVLVWNASVLGVLIGNLSQSLIEVPVRTFPYLPHGIPEIGGYVLAGIAGALLSYQVELHLFGEEELASEYVLARDALLLLAIGVALILVAGVIEAM